MLCNMLGPPMNARTTFCWRSIIFYEAQRPCKKKQQSLKGKEISEQTSDHQSTLERQQVVHPLILQHMHTYVVKLLASPSLGDSWKLLIRPSWELLIGPMYGLPAFVVVIFHKIAWWHKQRLVHVGGNMGSACLLCLRFVFSFCFCVLFPLQKTKRHLFSLKTGSFAFPEQQTYQENTPPHHPPL